jgi:hypothetical protein
MCHHAAQCLKCWKRRLLRLQTTHRWEITLMRQRGRFVDAPDPETAIKVAIEQFEITNPEQQKRLIARQTDA